MPGEVAALIIEGSLCAQCHVYLDDKEEGYAGPLGYPRFCRRCGGKPELNGRRAEGDPRRGSLRQDKPMRRKRPR
jgi:hypothetical protein